MFKSIVIAALLFFLATGNMFAQTELIVTSEVQGKFINAGGMKFEAKGVCSVDEGDIIVFRGPTHNCHTTVFYNRSKGNTCTVYCLKY